jgi:Big-like domain-containing protein
VTKFLWSALLACALLLAVPALAGAAVSPEQPFPSNLLTTPDATQLTGLRVDLPKPDCTARPSDCQDIDVLNTYDGFNVDARISIPFTGGIDLSTVTPNSVFLVGPLGQRVPLIRLVWTAATNTLHGNPATYLNQDTTYLLVVTNAVKDADGNDLQQTFRRDLNFGQTKDPATKAYRKDLIDAMDASGVDPDTIVDASLFTTQSITSVLEKVRGQIDASNPAPATFALGPAGAPTVFPYSAGLLMTFNRQVGTAPTFQTSVLPTAINIFPGAIGTVAFGRYTSPNYENGSQIFPAVGSKTGTPTPQGTNQIYFDLYLPAGAAPAGGWPVAIVGHGFTDSKQGLPITTASTMASKGIATIAINVVGHGGGPLGTLTVSGPGVPTPVTFPAGGRGIDQNGNGTIDSTEGVAAAPPFTLVNSRDGLRQTVIDLMQLVREIQVGVDVNNDGVRDLNPAKISYFGQSFGGIYGTTFMGTEPDVPVGVVNVPGGSIPEIARLSPAFRGLVGLALISRTPSLYNNAAPNAGLTNFDENMPLTGEPIRVDNVPGADAIQAFNDAGIWAQAPADPVAYARYIRLAPLAGVPAKSIIVQFAKGDQTVPNPTASALIRAGALEDRATYFRNDIAFATIPGYTVKNPHTFLSNVTSPTAGPLAVAAQTQIGVFIASGGATTIDPDGAGPLFETPIVGPLPEQLNFIP